MLFNILHRQTQFPSVIIEANDTCGSVTINARSRGELARAVRVLVAFIKSAGLDFSPNWDRSCLPNTRTDVRKILRIPFGSWAHLKMQAIARARVEIENCILKQIDLKDCG